MLDLDPSPICSWQAFAQAAQRAGAQFYPHQEVTSLLTQNNKVIGVHTAQGETIACKQLIIASGAWAAQCSAWLHIALPITPLHGQMIALQQPTPGLKHIIFGEAAYITPKGTTLLVGATKEDLGFSTIVTQAGTSRLYEAASHLLPLLAQGTIQAAWAGLRPKTPDSHPIVDFLMPWENVLVAAGHNSVGIILSAITGQCVTEMVMTRQTPALMQPFGMQRFLSY